MDTADAEIRVPSADNPKLSKVLSFEPGVSQNTASQALPAARNSTLLLYTFQVHSSSSSFRILLQFFFASGVANAISCVGPRYEIGHYVRHQRRLIQVPVPRARRIQRLQKVRLSVCLSVCL